MAKVIFGSKAQAIRSIITTKYFKEGGLDIPLEAAKGIRIIGPSKKEDLWDKRVFALLAPLRRRIFGIRSAAR